MDGFDDGRDKFSKVVGVWGCGDAGMEGGMCECGDGIGKDVRM